MNENDLLQEKQEESSYDTEILSKKEPEERIRGEYTDRNVVFKRSWWYVVSC